MRALTGWCLIVAGLAMSYSSGYTIAVWPRRFRGDWSEWSIGVLGLVIATVGAWLVWGEKP